MTTDITISLSDSEVDMLRKVISSKVTAALNNDGYSPDLISFVEKAIIAAQPRYIPQPGDTFRIDNGSTTTWCVIQPTSVLAHLETEAYEDGTIFCVDSNGWFEPFTPGELLSYWFTKIEVG